MSMKVRPLADRVLVRPMREDEATKAGIILPETVEKERPEKGQVVSTGPGRLLDNGARAPLTVKTGDKIVFKKYSPDEVKVDDEELLLIREEDILAVLE